MEIDPAADIIEEGEEKGEKDLKKEGKRTKWQLPPSHHNLIGPPQVTPKSKFTSHRHHQQQTSNNMDELGNNIPDSFEPVSGNTESMSLRDVANALGDSKLSRL
jgi:hypothetical protein